MRCSSFTLFKEHIELGVECNFDQFANVIIENVDVFCKITKTDFISEFQKLDLEFIKDFRIELIGCCKSLLPEKYVFTPIRKTGNNRLCEDIFNLIQMLANKKTAKMVTLKKIFNLSDRSNLTTQQKKHATNSASQVDSSNNDFLNSTEVLFLELEEFKNEISEKAEKKFECLMNEFAKLKEENLKIIKENDQLINRISILENKINNINLIDNETQNTQNLNKSVFSQQIPATAFASNVFTFGSQKLNESQYPNIQNKNGKRTFSNIVSDSNKENESRPSSLAKKTFGLSQFIKTKKT